jgi:hypothetical protein
MALSMFRSMEEQSEDCGGYAGPAYRAGKEQIGFGSLPNLI